jgi:hypothetical protein
MASALSIFVGLQDAIFAAETGAAENINAEIAATPISLLIFDPRQHEIGVTADN